MGYRDYFNTINVRIYNSRNLIWVIGDDYYIHATLIYNSRNLIWVIGPFESVPSPLSTIVEI